MTAKTLVLLFLAIWCYLNTLGAPRAQPAAEWQYSVKPGDNPWRITERLLSGMKYWPMVQKHNGIVDPLNIAPGTVLRIPIEWLRPEPGHAVIIAVSTGGCLTPRDGDATVNLQKGEKLSAGVLVRSNAGGSCTLQFPDRSKILLLENSELRLERILSYAMTGMHDIVSRLVRGRAESSVTPATGPASRFEIHSPQGVTSVRGTAYRVASLGTDARAEVIEGRVEVRNGLGQVELEAGTGTVYSDAAAPSAPTPLLAPPDLAGLPATLRLSQAAPAFSAVQGAVAYRQQFSPDAGFEQILSDARTENATLLVPALAQGDYFLRVRAVDALGLEGRDALRAIRLEQSLPAPQGCTPGNGSKVKTREVSTACQSVPTAQWYRIQLAQERDFSSPLIDRLGSQPAGELSLDRPGRFFWRMAAIDSSGREGDYTPPMALVRGIEPPALDVAELGRDSITFSWQPPGAGLRYRLQLAADADFQAMLEDQITVGNRLVLPRPKPAAYFVRIGVLEDADGEPAYGPPRGLTIPPTGNLDWLPPLGLVFLFLI